MEEFFEVEVSNVQIIIKTDPPYYVGDLIEIKGEATISGEAAPDETTYTYTIIGPDGNKVDDDQIREVTRFRAALSGEYNIHLTVTATASGGSTPDTHSDDADIKIAVFQKGEEIIKITSPTNNQEISSMPFVIGFRVDGSLLQENHTAFIQIDGILDSSFIVQTGFLQPFSYIKSCLSSGEYEIKAIIRDNGTNGYTRIDSSTVNITVPAGITCEPEVEELVTVEIISPANNEVLHTLPEIKIKATAVGNLAYMGIDIGTTFGFSVYASGKVDSTSIPLEIESLEIGINEIIARAEDSNGIIARDTIYIDWQPAWSVAATFPSYNFPFNSIGFSNNDGVAFIGMGESKNCCLTDEIYKYDPNGNNSLAVINNYPGYAREGSAYFTIGQYAYIGMGTDYVGTGASYNEFYKYDMVNDTWSPLGDFPGEGRSLAIAFVLNGKGYVGSGSYYNNNTFVQEALKDLWEYDPGTDTWTQVADLPGAARHQAFAFTVSGKAYFGGGIIPNSSTYFKDLWEFNGTNWTQKADMPLPGSEGVYEAAAVTLNGLGYIVGGNGYTAINQQGMWSYDPASNSWTTRTLAPFAQYEGQIHYAFVIDDLIYAGTVIDPFSNKGRIWIYNPSSDPN